MKVEVKGTDVEVVEPGKGHWRFTPHAPACGYELKGYDGENFLYIFLMDLQSGGYHAAVVHCQLDSHHRVATGLLGKTAGEMTHRLNEFIKLVGIEN